MMAQEKSADLAIVGAGIEGLAHALAAAKKGLSVVVFERSEYPVGASVRSLGLLFTLLLEAGKTQEWALKSREIWLDLAVKVNFAVHRCGSVIVANHRDEWDVLSEFYLQTGALGGQCRLLDPRETLVRLPMLQNRALRGGLWSQYEVQVRPREAIPAIIRYLEEVYDVRFVWGAQVQGLELPRIETSLGNWQAERAVVCPGDDYQTLYADLLARQALTRCKLQMLRIGLQPRGWQLPCILLSGLSLLRYPAFAQCPSLPRLRKRLEADKFETLRFGVHLILCQGFAGDLIVGDSHEYGLTPSPFNSGRIDELLLQHAKALVNIKNTRIVERWSGVYAYSEQYDHLILSPTPAIRLVLITSEIGMSVAFALADEVITDLLAH